MVRLSQKSSTEDGGDFMSLVLVLGGQPLRAGARPPTRVHFHVGLQALWLEEPGRRHAMGHRQRHRGVPAHP